MNGRPWTEDEIESLIAWMKKGGLERRWARDNGRTLDAVLQKNVELRDKGRLKRGADDRKAIENCAAHIVAEVSARRGRGQSYNDIGKALSLRTPVVKGIWHGVVARREKENAESRRRREINRYGPEGHWRNHFRVEAGGEH